MISSSFHVVPAQVAQVTTLAEGCLPQATAGLDNKAGSLTLEGVSTTGAVATTQNISLHVAQEMVDSYVFDRETGVSIFTVPAGVTDVQAMKALNDYFKKYFPEFARDAVSAGDLDWYANLPQEYPNYCQERNYSHARQITITGVVNGTEGNHHTLECVLKKQSLLFADPRDLALAAAIHACKNHGEDLFKGLWLYGSVPGFGLCTLPGDGVFVLNAHDVYHLHRVAASGSPSPG